MKLWRGLIMQVELVRVTSSVLQLILVRRRFHSLIFLFTNQSPVLLATINGSSFSCGSLGDDYRWHVCRDLMCQSP